MLRILIKFLEMIPSQDENNNRIDFKVETLNTTIQRDKDNIPQSSILSQIFKRNFDRYVLLFLRAD